MARRKKIKTLPLRSDYGWVDLDTKQIVLSSVLKERAIPSKALVLNHELAHLWVNEKKIKLSAAQEELFCDLVALFKCKSSQLSLLERQLKKILIDDIGRNPSKRKILRLV